MSARILAEAGTPMRGDGPPPPGYGAPPGGPPPGYGQGGGGYGKGDYGPPPSPSAKISS